MEITDTIIKILGFIIIALGVILIFDARKIAQKWFSYGEKNSVVRILKIVGFILTVIGGLIIMIKY